MAQFLFAPLSAVVGPGRLPKSVAGGHVSPLPEESWLRSAGVFTILDGAGSEVLDIVGPRVAREESHDSLRGRYARRRLADSAETLKRMRESAALGNGHHGAVYRGTNARIGRVAVKVLDRASATPASDARLRREAAAMRLLGGRPGFPRLYYRGRQPVFGRVSDVFVMELLGPSAEARCGLSAAAAEGDDGGDDDAGLCEGRLLSGATVLRVGRELLHCLEALHGEQLIHNDLKPTNFLFGPPGTETADTVHLIDFGQVTRPGEALPTEEGSDKLLQYGGGTPLFASVAAHEGQPTVAADDVESLWYSLAYLAQGTLPWLWEPPDVVASIKRRMMADECATVTDECEMSAGEVCSTAHCSSTVESWLDGSGLDSQAAEAAEALYELWGEVVAQRDDPEAGVDYAACRRALGEE